MTETILVVKDLTVQFNCGKQALNAVDGLCLDVRKGEILGLVGESGSGKTQAMLAVMRLTQASGKVSSGSVFFHDEDVMLKSQAEMCALRGKHIAMIFQDPMAALDPVYTCGQQMIETLLCHERIPRKQARERCVEMLQSVGLNNPNIIMNSYPFEISGGMSQRVMIAMALLCSPEVLIADEPTTALDVTVQAQILDLLLKIREEQNMSIVLISHDLVMVSEVTDRVVVLYAGRVMEEAPTNQIIYQPVHPYSRGLLKTVVHLDTDAKQKLHIIPGIVPELAEIPSGCSFSTRCQYATAKCIKRRPPGQEFAPGHRVFCFLNESVMEFQA